MGIKFFTRQKLDYLLINLNSVVVKTLGFFIFIFFIKSNWFGNLIYSTSLMLILTSLFSSLVIIPSLENKQKFRYAKTLYSITFLFVILLSSFVSKSSDIAIYTIVLTSLNYMVDLNKKIYSSENKILLRHELFSIFLYILFFILLYKEEPLLIVILILPILIISFKTLNKLKGKDSSLLSNLNYCKSSLWLTFLSFISSNFIFVYLNGLITPELFNTINSYRVLFSPIGVITGFIENKIMTLKKMFFNIPMFLLFAIPFAILPLFIFPNLYSYVAMGIIAFIYMSIIRLNNMYFRKSYLDNIIIKFSVINLILIIVLNLLIIKYSSAYYIYYANIISLTLVQWNYQKKIED